MHLSSFSQRGVGALASLIVVGVISAVGCGSSSELAGADETPVPITGEGALVFDHEGTVKIAPGEVVEVTVVGQPPKPYAISFYLVGDALDASLDQASIVADANSGAATVALRAPSHATNFVLRATIKDGGFADLPVAVSDAGFGAIEVRPEYGGTRTAETWEVRVTSGTTCDALSDTFPVDPEGALATTAPADAEGGAASPIIIEDAPVGPNLAVFVRSGYYMWGCVDETDLVADGTRVVKVPISDVPIDLHDVSLDIALEFKPETEPWNALITQTRLLMMAAFFGDSESDGTMLLDAMKTAALDPQSFADASSNGSWAEAMADHVAANEVDIQLLVQQLVASGLAAPPPSLHGSLESIDGVDDQALFTFSSLGSISAAMAGVPSEYVMSLTVDPDDTVRLGGTLYWLPTRYLGSVVEKTALGDGNQPSSFEEALSDAASCQSLTLDGYDGCDNQCIIELCENGLAQRWATALDASAANLQSVDVPLLASGVVIHDDDATLTGFEGSWLGNITGAGAEVKVSGNASATPKAPEPSR